MSKGQLQTETAKVTNGAFAQAGNGGGVLNDDVYVQLKEAVASGIANQDPIYYENIEKIIEGSRVRKFDYVVEANLTLSDKFYGNLVARKLFNKALNEAIQALTQLDKIKKTLFYGRDNNLDPAEGERDCSSLPNSIAEFNAGIDGGFSESDAANYIHGVIGIATEAGELLEGLHNVLNSDAIDLVNIKEEIGDVKWYMAILANVARFEWGDDERVNIAKLRARFPNAFTEYDAQNRDLKKERGILESHLPVSHRTARMAGENNQDGEAIEKQKNS